MRPATYLKLGQTAGVVMAGLGVGLYATSPDKPFGLIAVGLLVFTGCRIALWLREK